MFCLRVPINQRCVWAHRDFSFIDESIEAAPAGTRLAFLDLRVDAQKKKIQRYAANGHQGSREKTELGPRTRTTGASAAAHRCAKEASDVPNK